MTSSRLLPALLLSCSFVARPAELQLFEAVEPHMGTLFRIKLYVETEGKANAAFRAAFDRVRQLDEMLSDYQPDTELSQVTVRAVGRPAPVSRDLFRVLQESQKIAGETEGAFDVTLGPLTHLWRDARKTRQVPAEAALADARRRCGFRNMHLDRARQSVTVDKPGMQLDAGGIAKGYAADEALAVIGALGIARALVAASGDLAFSDPPPGKDGWTIGTDSLRLSLRNAAVSTSGDTEQHLDSKGRRYSHVLNPLTGVGLTSGLLVTVVAPSGMEADALTKVVSVWGREKGLAWIRQKPGVRAFVSGGS